MDTFTPQELDYLRSQVLGRLATIDASGTPQNSPVAFEVADDGTVRIRGWVLDQSRKFRNVAGNGRVSFVVDDVPSVDPWIARGVEIRGQAEALTDVEPPQPYLARAEIRIRPERIIGWGLDAEVPAGAA